MPPGGVLREKREEVGKEQLDGGDRGRGKEKETLSIALPVREEGDDIITTNPRESRTEKTKVYSGMRARKTRGADERKRRIFREIEHFTENGCNSKGG